MQAMTLKALALNCTLKPSPEESSCQVLLDHLLEQLAGHDVEAETVRVVDHDVRLGVTSDEGDGDAWPEIPEKTAESAATLARNAAHLARLLKADGYPAED